jgi:hypothetical protein
VEFNATRRFLRGGLRPIVGEHVKLEAFERDLAATTTLEECWQAMCVFGRTRLRTGDGAFWQMRLNLPNREFVDITQREGAVEQPFLVIAFAELVRRVLPVRLEQIATASASLASLTEALEPAATPQAAPRNSSTRTVISSDCAAPSVNPLTAS